MKPDQFSSRRVDRQQTDEPFLSDMLNNSMVSSIAVETDEHPLLHVTFFYFDKADNAICFHFSKYGYGANFLVDDKKATVSLFKYGRLYTAEKAVNFGCEYQSVIIYGKIKVVTAPGERKQAFEMFFNKFFGHIPASEYEAFTETESNPTFVVKVKIDQWIGKQHRLPPHSSAGFYSTISPLMS